MPIPPLTRIIHAVKGTFSTHRKDWLTAYNRTRAAHDRHLVCKAPFNSMYFNVYGQCAPCWLTLENSDTYPERSVREIWFGDTFNKLRAAIREQDLDYKCHTCKKNILNGNHVSVLSKLYDYDYALEEYPAVMEFELSNTCNLECVMCKGDLSSTIRKNRENLPPLALPYDDAFVDQLEEFIPHLKEAKFLGGEPFLVDIYYKIWDRIAAINPKVKITITTNGSVYNQKVAKVLELLNCHIILSLDSVFKDTYEAIRIHGKLDRVLENFEHFRQYTAQRKNYMGVSVNPLRKNWHELHEYVNFCNEKDVSIWFNTVVYPHDEALWTLPPDKLQEIYSFLSAQKIKPGKTGNKSLYASNEKKYLNLVEVQVKNWLADAQKVQAEKEAIPQEVLRKNVGEMLLRELENYIMEDAYIVPQHKKNRVRDIREKIAFLKASDPGRLTHLYLLPASSGLAELEKFVPEKTGIPSDQIPG